MWGQRIGFQGRKLISLCVLTIKRLRHLPITFTYNDYPQRLDINRELCTDRDFAFRQGKIARKEGVYK